MSNSASTVTVDGSATAQGPGWALVTGGAKRLGRAIALELAKNGWGIVLHYRHSEHDAHATAALVAALGVPCQVLAADLENPTEVRQLFDKAAQCGPVRCVVNNASLFEFDSCVQSGLPPSSPASQQFDAPLFNRHMAANLMAPILLAQALHAHVPAGQQGVVVNLLDQKLKNLNPDFLSYTLSKAGLDTATTLLAMELAPAVRVVGVAPGLTMISHLQTPEQFARAHQISPLKRSSLPEDVAQTVAFVVGNRAITGSTIYVDGGQHLVPMARDFSLLAPGGQAS